MKLKRVLPYIVLGVCIVLIGAVIFLHINADNNQTNILPKSNGDVKILDYSKYNISDTKSAFKISVQKKLHQQVKKLEKKKYSFSNMLVLSNPYLTNTTGLYVHFSTTKDVKVSYSIKTSDSKIPTYSKNLYNSKGKYAKKHSYQIIGLVAGEKNYITITAKSKNGKKYTKTIVYKPGKLISGKKNHISIGKKKSRQHLSSGLYTFIGDKNVKKRVTYLVDNDGYIRAELPIIGYNSLRLVNRKDYLYYAVNSSIIVKVNRLGRIVKEYNVGTQGYELHHDFSINSEGDIVALATNIKAKEKTKYIEDRIIKISNKTGKVTELINFRHTFPDLYKKATKIADVGSNKGYHDVMHMNSIQIVGSSLIVSSRETSTILKINSYKKDPQISYMISDSSIWQGVGDYSDKLLKKINFFVSQAGQHSVNYISTNKKGEYYLELFNNNSGINTSRNTFSWSNYAGIGSVKSSKTSYSEYYKYLVNEKKGTYKLVNSFKVPYSSFVGSVQSKNGNVIVDSGLDGYVQEYDKNNKMILSFKTSKKYAYLYRVYKYDFYNLWFNKK
ncbi:aryl-sulfate sulfotransferase [Liquorilactobacillus mali]|uniref:aryl-sulfate sulfotransferase n=1 Tax=Liquorilactobacillus mali TaxID=1618 RepID=UPI002953778C|nr:aryl-sulfate sulfotransferase [Liquorilactobacillus mali]MDV7756860.1 hypothetical protein [Liquorilactobacillus mali]